MNHIQKEKFQQGLERFGFDRMKPKDADAGGQAQGLQEQAPQEMTVTFLGVRGSVPLGGRKREKYGGETACVHVKAGGQDLFLDAGTGIAESGAFVNLTSDPVILLSHFHLDHLQGLMLSDLMLTPGLRLRILGPGPAGAAGAGSRTEAAVRRMMGPPLWPVGPEQLQAEVVFQDIPVSEGRGSLSFAGAAAAPDGPAGEAKKDAPAGASYNARAGGEPVQVAVMEGNHPGGVLLFRISWNGKSVVYATDCIFGSIEAPEGAPAANPGTISCPPEAALEAAEQPARGAEAARPEERDFAETSAWPENPASGAFFPPEWIRIRQKYIDFAGGCDLLIADGQYSDREWLKKSHFGHSSMTMAAELGRRCGAGQTVIIHHDHGASDQALDAFDRYLRLHYTGCRMGRRGDMITL